MDFYYSLAYVHLGTILPAFLIGTYLLINRKGTPVHRTLGKIYMGLMLFTGAITLLMPAKIGPTLFGHFGYIHSLSLLTLITVPRSYFAARSHKIKIHRNNMIALYVGGLLIAGGFTFLPGRIMHDFFFAG